MININNCKEVFIEEQDKRYLVKFMDVNNKMSMTEYVKNDVGIKNICDLVYNFVNVYGVNGINNSIPIFHRYLNPTVDIFMCNSNKKISMKIYNQGFKNMNKSLLDNYLVNRDEFFKNEIINNIVITAKNDARKFEMVDNVVNLTLNTDTNMNICVPEREFIRNFLEDKCYGRIINVDFILDRNGMKKSVVVTCGDFMMTFPVGFTYSTILGIISEHNNQINEIRKRR